MTKHSTTTGWALPWDEAGTDRGAEALTLAISWCIEAPRRVGEVARIEAPTLLGRAEDETFTLARFARERPSSAGPGEPLSDSRISRRQLLLYPEEGRLRVENVGKCPLLVNGVETSRAVVAEGDTLALKNVLVLLVVLRARPAPLRAYPARLAFPFGETDPLGIVGESPAAWQLRDTLALAASASGHVLVHGPSGSGKELAARALHALSSRASRPFLARNAATFPEGLIDAELFGNVKNYPNPGMPERRGLVGDAHEGTLFLDEIGELPPALQAHLLRVLDSGGEYQRLGESRTSRSDLRVVAATNRPLDELKSDFLARFSTRVEVPSLARRMEDVPLLVRHILARRRAAEPHLARFFPDELDGEARIAPALMDVLVRHRYALEQRELERLVGLAAASSTQHFVGLTPDVLAEVEAPTEERADVPGAEIGRQQIEEALAKARGSVTSAARALGLKNRFALYRLMKRHGIEAALPSDDEPGDG